MIDQGHNKSTKLEIDKIDTYNNSFSENTHSKTLVKNAKAKYSTILNT